MSVKIIEFCCPECVRVWVLVALKYIPEFCREQLIFIPVIFIRSSLRIIFVEKKLSPPYNLLQKSMRDVTFFFSKSSRISHEVTNLTFRIFKPNY